MPVVHFDDIFSEHLVGYVSHAVQGTGQEGVAKETGGWKCHEMVRVDVPESRQRNVEPAGQKESGEYERYKIRPGTVKAETDPQEDSGGKKNDYKRHPALRNFHQIKVLSRSVQIGFYHNCHSNGRNKFQE